MIGKISLSLALGVFASRLYLACARLFPWDFAINWTAAFALREGAPLYDMAALGLRARSLLGDAMTDMFSSPFSSYIGPPSTALLYLPLTGLSFATALLVYRAMVTLAFGGALVVASRSLLPAHRSRALVAGLFALLLFDSVYSSIAVGQVDGWVALSLAISWWGYRRGSWYWAGAGAGLATVLKISPIVLLVYFLLQRRMRAVAAAVLTIGIALGLAAAVGGVENIRTFAVHVAPVLSQATLHLDNQSLPAYLARLTSAASDFDNEEVGLGPYRFASLAIAGATVLCLWSRHRRRSEHVLTVPLLIVAALLAGPLTWDHYISWTIVPLAAVVGEGFSQERPIAERRILGAALLGSAVLLALRESYVLSTDIVPFVGLRLLTGLNTVGLAMLFATIVWLMRSALPHAAVAAPARQTPT